MKKNIVIIALLIIGAMVVHDRPWVKPPKTTIVHYTIQSGDTLTSIADKVLKIHNSTSGIAKIMKGNHLPTDEIMPGTVLDIVVDVNEEVK